MTVKNRDSRDSRDSHRDVRELAKRAVQVSKTLGPLYVDPRNLEKGFRYIFPVDEPRSLTFYEKLGYEIVQDQFPVGDQKASATTRHGSAVTITSPCGRVHVLMRMPEELAVAIDDELAKEENKLVESLQNPLHIPKSELIGQLLFK